ncbi:hypothetical protein E2C01_045633 [Portunus trituberculatus]|uniref:Uncharacterized protein n=1 Tax=Portunus trituberculatus TaxID=210409 RepID=A0A5B7G2K7_PORTR|nr:hypothetical protein [Portunus trituberculatus]
MNIWLGERQYAFWLHNTQHTEKTQQTPSFHCLGRSSVGWREREHRLSKCSPPYIGLEGKARARQFVCIYGTVTGSADAMVRPGIDGILLCMYGSVFCLTYHLFFLMQIQMLGL